MFSKDETYLDKLGYRLGRSMLPLWIKQGLKWARHYSPPQLIRYYQPQVLILLYHRIFKSSFNAQLACVSPKNLSEHLNYLKKHCQILSFSELIKGINERKLPKRGIVVTFDDGYRDILYNAKPLLEKYKVPATVFVTSGKIDGRREFWWDELERIIFRDLPKDYLLDLQIDGEKISQILASEKDREKSYWEIYKMLYKKSAFECEKILDKFIQDKSIESFPRKEYKVLNSEEIKELIKDGWIDVGAHTVTHSPLISLSQEEQEREIKESKRNLEDILGRQVKFFSYPFGRTSDVSFFTEKIVKKSGFDAAVATHLRAVYKNSDTFWLPRFSVKNWDGNTFARKLRNFWGR